MNIWNLKANPPEYYKDILKELEIRGSMRGNILKRIMTEKLVRWKKKHAWRVQNVRAAWCWQSTLVLDFASKRILKITSTLILRQTVLQMHILMSTLIIKRIFLLTV